MKNNIITAATVLLTVTASAFLSLFSSCQDDTSPIGSSLVNNEVSITVDTLEMKLTASSVYEPEFDSRTQSKLLGRINVPEYGSLDCSFVSQLMCSTQLTIPDSIPVSDVDSIRLVLTLPRGSLTGDSLAPQQLKVYKLTKQLPADIDNTFDPKGYYNPSSPLGVKSYTLSALSMNDSLFKKQEAISIPVKLPAQLAKEVYTAYKNSPETFQWPQNFAKYFPGVYVEQNFGNGCLGLISSLKVFTYWHYIRQVYQKKDDDSGDYEYVPTIKRDSVCLFSSQPEVLSANRVTYNVSDKIKNLVAKGKSVITTPGGYYVNIKFPAQEIIDKYDKDLYRVSVVSKLSFEIPAKVIENDFDITVAPNMLMIKSSEREKFFAENKIPDGKTSFYAPYNSATKSYNFNSMRDYILDLINSGKPVDPADMEFSLVPVTVTTEDVPGYSSTTTYVTRCAPYIGRPTMTLLDTDKATICFTYSRQTME